ncbi:MAG: undecaprenyl-diphosphate phosphatase [Lachnospiraceae bacterium]
MTLLQAIFMGVIQGITEFLPISSSGHLALFKNLFHVNTDTGVLFDVLLHIGTLAAVCVMYHHDIGKMISEFWGILKDSFQNLKTWINNMGDTPDEVYIRVVRNSYRKLVLLILFSTIPTAIIGLAAKDLTAMADAMMIIPGIGLLITSVILFVADRLPEGNKLPGHVTFTNAFLIGISQGIATLPGISRSGMTVTACIASGFKRTFAVKYSFLMSIPAIIGSLILELTEISSVSVSTPEVLYYLVGMIVAAVVGYICIQTMLFIVKNKKFSFFAVYCLLIGALSVESYFYTA